MATLFISFGLVFSVRELCFSSRAGTADSVGGHSPPVSVRGAGSVACESLAEVSAVKDHTADWLSCVSIERQRSKCRWMSCDVHCIPFAIDVLGQSCNR